ncbi:sulfatase-like hydrolase/transferase [Zobellia galactanivorans]|uniref:Sulfatase, family S1-28 n=1 Tax=Zobellia galactanivorans (strain DSM 12802 / CCUG 47099 / CIP 106680 / NCIMB 13871 / Dsij) TaxID=63186 RepID=G0L1M8_ZOBGA|nr:sulfatase-like hydrolase/transferase [Zobellia galactanivorans]CAZ97768.1 Sulfatase, family S1-28 [Zobellia galactanivorans]
MNFKKQFTVYVLVFFSALLGLPIQAQKRKTKKKDQPNVLIIYTDDHRFSGVHALGGMQVKTPNIDALIADGVSFSNGYLMGAFSGATCVPSRAMLLTGRNVFDLQGQGHSIPPEHTTIGEALQANDYNTHIVGKWHQDNASLARSFDSGDRLMSRGLYLIDHFRMPLWDWKKDGDYKFEDGYLLEYDKNGKVVRRPISKEDKRGPTGTKKNGPHTSEIYAESASEYIKGYKKKNPFFMYLAFHAPHDPRQAPQEYKDMYPVEDIVLPPSYMAQHPFDNGDMFLRDEELAVWPRTPEVAKQELSDYYAIITHLDAQIGKVIASLKESGAYKNTLIVFAGDSGLAVGNHGLMGKQNIYDEDGVHIPLIFSGNLIKDKGSKRDALAYNFDIFPTICAFIGVDIPSSVTGKSLLPVINKEKASVRDYTYHAYKQFQRAYRKGDYKLIEYVRAKNYDKKNGETVKGSRVTQLFNIKNDPWEVYDLSFFPEYADQVKTMRKEMKEKAKELGDIKENIEGEKYGFWEFY